MAIVKQYWVAAICALLLVITVLHFDRLFFKILNLRKHRLGYESSRLVEYETVWSVSPAPMISKRSVFNPDMWYDSSKKLWYVIARYTKGHRFSQLISCMISEKDNLQVAMILFTLDDNFNQISQREVYVEKEPMEGYQPSVSYWSNGEDPRLFFDDSMGKYVIQATIHNLDKSIHIAHGVLVENKQGLLLWKIFRVCGIDGVSKYQKNWSYIGKNVYLSHCFPKWQIVKMNELGDSTIVRQCDTIINNNLRCTSKFCLFTAHSYLTLLHTYNQFYRCVFCEVDRKTLLPIRYSKPIDFTEDTSYVEFPSGLFILNDRVYVGLGINDVECKIIRIHKDVIDRYLAEY